MLLLERGDCFKPLSTKCNLIINMQINDDRCKMWSFIAKIHPAKDDRNTVSKYSKTKHIIIINLPNIQPSYEHYLLRKIQEKKR